MECVLEVASFPLKCKVVTGIVALPGGGFATGLHRNAVIHVWSSAGESRTGVTDDAAVTAVASTAAGDIVSGTTRGAVKLWHGRTCVRVFGGHAAETSGLAVSPVDGTIVSCSQDGTATVWNASTGECVANLEGHSASVMAVCVLPNGDVVTGAFDNTVRVWERGSWTCAAVYEQPSVVRGVVALGGGAIAVGGGDYDAVGFVSQWVGGLETWRFPAKSFVYQIAAVKGLVVACMRPFVVLLHDGVCVCQLGAHDPRAVLLPEGLAVLQRYDEQTKYRLFHVFRPPRLATVHTMVVAWSVCGGVPPPLAPSPSPVAVLARTLSLRRFCRARDVEGRVEVVEPFARDIVGYM